MPGLTDSGLDAPNLNEIKEAQEDALRARLGNSLDFLPSTVNAQITGAIAEQIASAWQALLNLYNGINPSAANGVLLEYLSALTGTTRQNPTKSTVTLDVDLDAAITLPVGRLVSHSTTGEQFSTTAEVTSTTAGVYTVQASSVNTGPIAALTGTLTEIDTPVTGWNSVTNAADAVPGSNLETDAELRVRRKTALTVQGSGTVDAITADVGAVDNVDLVRGFENTSNVTDGDGRPETSFEIVLLDLSPADDDEIAQAIWDSKPAGMEAYSRSADSGTATDDNGNSQTVAFTRATQVPMHINVELEKNPATYAGDTAVRDAILAASDENQIGTTIYASAFYSAVFTVAGVENITVLEVDNTDPPSATEITLADNEAPSFDSANIDVVSSDV